MLSGIRILMFQKILLPSSSAKINMSLTGRTRRYKDCVNLGRGLL
jgi:hypothetical protein